MKPIIISCEILRNEVQHAMDLCKVDYPVIWLEPALHNFPKKLNQAIQRHLDDLRGYDTVLLAMSLCGNAVVGLESREFRMVLPRCDDCISLLLDGDPRPIDSLFMTEGWLKGGQHIGQEYDECLKKYGEKRGSRIFAAMLKNYRSVAMLNTGCYDTDIAEPQIRAIGEKLGLGYREVRGTANYLVDLIRGDWGKERFVVLPEYSTLTIGDCLWKGEDCHA